MTPRQVGQTGPGRRYATEQASHFYAVLLSAHFQGFCRDLHSECVQRIAQEIPASLQNVVRGWFQHGRKLDRGNPNPKNIAEDFGRLGLVMWDKVKALDSRNERRRQLLEELMTNPALQATAKTGPRLSAWSKCCRRT